MTPTKSELSLKRMRTALTVLSVLIVGLMALGAGVRTMNAGLSCPDWPLCFGQVIPDFHVGVWFEFVHRAYAGLVALVFAATVIWVLRSSATSEGAKTAARWGAFFLGLQIVMGGLTVLLLVKAVIVTGHLLLATLFLASVLWMRFSIQDERDGSVRNQRCDRSQNQTPPVGSLVLTMSRFGFLLPLLVFVQIAIGGFVASTYAGSVCIDWPLCNGQWIPTWKGPIGLQIFHRFYAYALVTGFFGLAISVWLRRHEFTTSTATLIYASSAVVAIQTVVGILNLLHFIPPHITVPHQTLAVVLFGLQLKIWHGLKLARRAVGPEMQV